MRYFSWDAGSGLTDQHCHPLNRFAVVAKKNNATKQQKTLSLFGCFFSGPSRFSSPHIDPVKSRFHTRMFTLKHCCDGSSMLFFSFSYFLLLVWQQIATFNSFFFSTDEKPLYLCFSCCTHRAEGNVLPGISHRFLTIRLCWGIAARLTIQER